MPTIRVAVALRETRADSLVGLSTPGAEMSWGGGAVQHGPRVYLVFWQWNSQSDPVANRLQSFFSGVGGSSWSQSQTQYCDNDPSLTGLDCAGAAPASFVGNPAGQLGGTWFDNADAIPVQPDDSQIQAEAARAAAHFSVYSTGAQFVVATPHNNSTNGFGTQWCAYHGSTVARGVTISYTDLPYIPDAGAACGQSFVNAGAGGAYDGVTMVAGHEYAESATDPQPGYGWTDALGNETGDKCAWISSGQGSATDVTFSSGTFAVQSLWSNSFGSAGGCVTHYASASSQG
jgi:serine protease